MKNIVLLVHDDNGQEARLRVALDLARALEGHLTCIDVTVLPMVIADMYGGADQALLIAEEQEREAQHRSALQQRLATENVSWNSVQLTGDISRAVIEYSTLADVIVLNRQLEERSLPDMRGITSRIVMETKAPVVAVPEGQEGFGTRRALIAWDASVSCAAALRASVPLLRLASEVRIFTVTGKSDTANLEPAAQYLLHHGVHGAVESVAADGRDTWDVIAGECGRWNADYLVMGAYGRGRLREAFGGVTKHMLSTSSVPVVLAH